MTNNTPRTFYLSALQFNVCSAKSCFALLILGQAAFISFIAYVRDRYYMLRYKLRIVIQYFKYTLYTHLYSCY